MDIVKTIKDLNINKLLEEIINEECKILKQVDIQECKSLFEISKGKEKKIMYSVYDYDDNLILTCSKQNQFIKDQLKRKVPEYVEQIDNFGALKFYRWCCSNYVIYKFID